MSIEPADCHPFSYPPPSRRSRRTPQHARGRGSGRRGLGSVRVLKRDPEEVKRKANQFFEATLEGWCSRHRCSGSPSKPAPVIALADDIYKEFREQEGDIYVLFKALEEAFRYFDPAKGNPALTAEWRFLRFFRHLLRRRLLRARERRRARRRREQRAILRLHKNMWAGAGQGEIGVYASWAKALYEVVLSRLDERTRTFLELRNSNRSVKEIAGLLGVSTKTLSNANGEAALVRRIRREVCTVVVSLPETNRRGIVPHLLFEGGLALAQVNRLLCVSPSLLEVKGWKGPPPDEDAALRLLQGTTQTTTAA